MADHAAKVVYGVSMAQTGESPGHGLEFDEKTIDQLVAFAAEKGVKSRFTHPGLSAGGLGTFLGRVRDPRKVLAKDGSYKAVGDLHLSDLAFTSPKGDMGTYVLDAADKEPEMMGFSVVVAMEKDVWVMEDGREVLHYDHINDKRGERQKPLGAINDFPAARFAKLKACDLVDEPAANRDGMFAALSGPSVLTAGMFEDIDLLLSRGGISIERAYEFALSYFDARGVTVGGGMPLPTIHGGMELPGGLSMSMANKDDMQETAAPAQPVEPAAQADQVVDWNGYLQTQATRLRLANVDLPALMRKRLQEATYANPEELENAITAAQAEVAQLKEREAVNLPGKAPRGHGTIAFGNDSDPVDRARGAVDWIFGVAGAEMPSLEYRKLDLLYVAMTGDAGFHGAYNPENVAFSASPVTLPGLAADAMQKIISAQFSRAAKWRWFEKIVSVEPNDGSLHDAKWITYGGTGNLPVVEDAGPYTEGTPGDAKEVDAFVKHGRYVGITRSMIKNSDIVAIRAIPIALAKDALRTRSASVSAIFTANAGVGPTLDQDATALFHANHSNIAMTAFSITSWRTATEECFAHAEIGSGKRIATFAKYALVPLDLYNAALIAFGYGVGMPTTHLPEGMQIGPDDPRPEPVLVPDWTDANDWGYVADPKDWPVIMMTYSQNPGGNTHPEPELFTAPEATAGLMFTNDVLPVKVRDEWAVGVNGPRGIGKRNVA